MIPQQLQHADKMTHATATSVALLKAAAKLRKAFRKLPIPVNIRVIQCSRTTCQCLQVVQRIEDFRAIHVTANMRGNQLVVLNHLNVVDKSLDRHHLECHLSRHAVTDVVESHHLVLIDDRRLSHAGFERMTWQRC